MRCLCLTTPYCISIFNLPNPPDEYSFLDTARVNLFYPVSSSILCSSGFISHNLSLRDTFLTTSSVIVCTKTKSRDPSIFHVTHQPSKHSTIVKKYTFPTGIANSVIYINHLLLYVSTEKFLYKSSSHFGRLIGINQLNKHNNFSVNIIYISIYPL